MLVSLSLVRVDTHHMSNESMILKHTKTEHVHSVTVLQMVGTTYVFTVLGSQKFEFWI